MAAVVLDPNAGGQKLAVDRLLELGTACGDRNVVPALQAALRSPHDFVAGAALDALVALGDPAAVAPLLDEVRGIADDKSRLTHVVIYDNFVSLRPEARAARR